ncbi:MULTISPECIES: hypothetical protein [unclassified Kribbella]|uniref:hypothetical protein n=1 Tax=unclassified Kribbella TaxID=2644121 RepID=UPI0033E8EEE6
MTSPSGPYEGLTPVTHEDPAEVTDTEVNEALERGDVDVRGQEIRHDDGAQPDSDRNDTPQPPTEESQA